MQSSDHNRLIIRVILFLFLFSSQNAFSQEEKKSLVFSMFPKRPVEECRKLLLKGDTMAYYDLYWTLADQKRDADYFFYSLFMIDKYNYRTAHYWAYMSVLFFYKDNKIPLDGQALNLALEHLMKGAEFDISGALIELGELYQKGMYVPQDTIKGAELREKGRRK